jgi:hypothetical protein
MPRRSTKSRGPDDIRQTALRMRESEHAWLVEDAKSHRTTLNAVIMWRVMRTRELDAATDLRRSIEDFQMNLEVSVQDLRTRLEPYLLSGRERDCYADALFAARQIVDENSAQLAAGQLEGRAGQRLRAMIDNFHLARRDLEIAFGEKVIGQTTPGFQARAEARLQQAGGKTPSNEEPPR